VGFNSSMFSVCPSVRKVNDKLIAETGLGLRISTLGCFYRKVVVDRKKEEVIISRRYLWLFKRSRHIRFAAIVAIEYGYQDISWGAWWSWAHKSEDIFTVKLRLHSGNERHLFQFAGEGEFQNDGPLPDWMYWEDYAFNCSGTQERESLVYVELLSKMIGVPIERAR
jgi:hypothetical protein